MFVCTHNTLSARRHMLRALVRVAVEWGAETRGNNCPAHNQRPPPCANLSPRRLLVERPPSTRRAMPSAPLQDFHGDIPLAKPHQPGAKASYEQRGLRSCRQLHLLA